MKKSLNIIIHAALVLGFIGAGVLGFILLKESREALGRQQAEIPLPLVRTMPVRMDTVDMTLTGEGTVQAARQSQIVAQVSGRVTRISDNLVNGGEFEKDELLLQIDPRDYEIAVTLARAAVKDARSKYETVRQESRAALREWRRMRPDKAPPPLVAKKPQLSAALSNLEAQRANLKKAGLNLERTRIKAPFAGRISSQQVDIGQYVAPGQSLATIYATDAVEIVVPMENADLGWFAVPGFTTDAKSGAKTTVRARVAGQDRQWQGRVLRVEGRINEKTRLVPVVIRVSAPYATRPPLSPGQFVEVAIKGRTLPHAAIIPRAALRGQNRVWTVDPESERLYFRTVAIARMDERGVVVRSGLKNTDQVVVSPLKAATDGMRVRSVTVNSGGWS